MAMKHVGSSWTVDDRIIVIASLGDKGTWRLTVNGVRDENEYESVDTAAEAALPAAEAMADLIRQIEALQAQLSALGVGVDEE